MEESKILSSIIGLIGVGLGALFGGIGYLFKVRAEKRKNLKRVLFNLLQVWNAVRLSKLDPSEVADDFMAVARKAAISVFNVDIEHDETLRQFVVSFVHKMLSQRNHSAISSLSDKYNECIVALSECEPVLAFQLNNRIQLSAMLSTLDEYNNIFLKMTHHNDLNKISFTQSYVKRDVVEGIQADLERDIRFVSLKSSISDLVMTQYKINEIKRKKGGKIDNINFQHRLEAAFNAVKHELEVVRAASPAREIALPNQEDTPA